MTRPSLAELVRQGERLLDAQIESTARQDQKSATLMGLATTILAGAAAIAGLVAPEGIGHWIWPFAALLGVGLACSTVSFACFLRAYTGSRKDESEIAVGWDPDQLNAAAREGDALDDVHRSTLLGISTWFKLNRHFLERGAYLRRRGNFWLAVGSAAIGASFLYIIVVNNVVR